MKSIRAVSVTFGILATFSTLAAEPRATKAAQLEAIKAELKPLREKAYLEADVLAAKKSLDDAYRAYWESVRAAMERLDPSKKKLIEKEIDLRKALNPVKSEKASAAKPSASPTPAKK